jgi:outer membrane protein OmpA-like peptidoglycan-associated protein
LSSRLERPIIRPSMVEARRAQCVLRLAAAAVLLSSSPVLGQGLDDFGLRNNVDVEHLEPRPLGFPGLGRSTNLRWREWAAGAFVHYANSPLVLFEGRLQVGEVVRHRLTLDLIGAVGLTDWLEVQAALPIVVFQSGDDGLPTGDLPVAGLKDLRLAAKVSLLDQAAGDPIGLAIRPDLHLPTGDRDGFLGTGSVRFVPTVLVDRSFAWLWGVHFAASLGLNLRPDADVGNAQIEDELVARFGAGLGLPGWERLRPLVFLELVTATRLESPFAEPEQTPLVGRMGLRMEWDRPSNRTWHGTAGLSGGSTRGYGSPDVQLFAGWVFEQRLGDRDGDGIVDRDDACPDTPEDRDGFEDDDGCPEVDFDRDGVPDDVDPCPTDPEDMDGFEDEDGCPESDNDRDGIPDPDDLCPVEPEDFDGFDDGDGCPEEDTDRDGVPDHLDACPDEQEVINGVEDDDGCPDEGQPQVEVTTEKMTIDSKVQFDFDSARIREESFGLLTQVAQTIKANPELRRIRIEGHTDDRGSAAYNLQLSKRRARSVLEFLVSRGVSEDRLESEGYGEELPLVLGTGEAVWAKNRRVEFTILRSEGGPSELRVPVDPAPVEGSTEPAGDEPNPTSPAP